MARLMTRLLALDFGLKRCGLAETDELQIIASPLAMVPTEKCIGYIEDYYAENKPETLIIGEPKQLRTGEAAALEKDILLFMEKLKERIPELKTERFDERFTSKMAAEANKTGGMKKSRRKQKGELDITAATILLQGYMDARRNKK